MPQRIVHQPQKNPKDHAAAQRKFKHSVLRSVGARNRAPLHVRRGYEKELRADVLRPDWVGQHQILNCQIYER